MIVDEKDELWEIAAAALATHFIIHHFSQIHLHNKTTLLWLDTPYIFKVMH